MEQCDARGGRYKRQVSQYLTLTVWPFTRTSLVLGNFKSGVALLTQSDDLKELDMLSESGGWEFLGIIPGLLEDVMKRKVKSYSRRKINHFYVVVCLKCKII